MRWSVGCPDSRVRDTKAGCVSVDGEQLPVLLDSTEDSAASGQEKIAQLAAMRK